MATTKAGMLTTKLADSAIVKHTVLCSFATLVANDFARGASSALESHFAHSLDHSIDELPSFTGDERSLVLS